MKTYSKSVQSLNEIKVTKINCKNVKIAESRELHKARVETYQKTLFSIESHRFENQNV